MNDEIINHEEAYQLALLKQKESNLARCYLDLLSKIEPVLAEMEEHRQRYTDENAKDGNDYWRGRRDEAGYFRDKLKVILEKP